MKTTNKLLIGLAIALFVFPVGGMVIWTKSNRLDEKAYHQIINSETKEFETADKYLVRNKLNSFHKVSISSTQNASISLYLVKSKDFGYKITKGFEDRFTSEVNSDGLLILKAKENTKFFNASVYIFAPSFDDLELSTIQIATLETDSDSLHMTMNNVQTLQGFADSKKMKMLNLTLNSSDISFPDEFPHLENFSLQLNNSSLALGTQTYERINVTLDNSSLLPTSENTNKKLFIKDLNISATGKSTLGFFTQEQIGKLSGYISDSTTVLMPIYVYKNLLGSK